MDTLPFGFDNAFLRKLERLALLARRPIAGPSPGPRRSTRYGSSVEFADYRDYSTGDDFRRVDWNAYARLDRMFVRLYRAEDMTTLSLFLDRSASMQVGTPPKALTAARLAAAFSYIAVHSFDRVVVAGWGDEIDRVIPSLSGKHSIPRVWQFIAEVMDAPQGGTDFAALRRYSAQRRRPGLSVVLTDFLTDSDWRSGLQALRAGGQDVSVIQVLAPEEIDPGGCSTPLRGDWKLCDAETAEEVDVTVSARLLRRYTERLAAYTAELQTFCHQHDIMFLQVSSDASLPDTVLSRLRAAGLVA